MAEYRKFSGFVFACAAAALFSGCATVDFDYPKVESNALPSSDTADSHLGRQVADIVAAHPGEAGFYPIPDGKDSLAMRLVMAERAEHSIDAQYFLIHDDLIGRLFVDALLRAADRGVRVRFLLDDVLSQGLDPGLAAFDSHENIEVRIFNPFAHRKARALDVTHLGRVTRRMHNKSFTIDNQVTLIGGRNIAAEYFDAREDEHFSDLDVFAIGPIVPEVSNMFDTYWNHSAAVPILALTDVPDNAAGALAELDDKVSKSLKTAETSPYADAVKSSVLRYIESDMHELVWAPYDLVYDSPDKSSAATAEGAERITGEMRNSIGVIEQQLFVLTPYFVLLDEDIELFRGMRDRGVDVTVLTNSLAANNHAAVHGAYGPTRKPLLKMGVNLYEVRANPDYPADQKLPSDAALTTLHAKSFVVDGKSIFIGSFNWNQRSVNRDTELGVIIHSPEMANMLVERVTRNLPTKSFAVSLNEDDKLRWTVIEDGQEVVVTKEPQTGAWKRFNAWIQRIVPKSQL